MFSAPLRSGLPDHLKQRIDYPDSTTQYVGWASPGSTTDQAVWAIHRITISSGRITQIDWADGDANPNNVWDDRASLDYS